MKIGKLFGIERRSTRSQRAGVWKPTIESLENRQLFAADALSFETSIPPAEVSPVPNEQNLVVISIIENIKSESTDARRGGEIEILKFDGIDGESTDKEHKSEIDLLSWSNDVRPSP